MKLTAATILTGVLLFLSPYALSPARISCSCTADDRTCSASASCPEGCVAHCPSRNCRAVCVDGEGGGDTGLLAQRVTLRLNGSDHNAAAAELARVSRAKVILFPTQPDATFNLEAKDMPLWDVLSILSADANIQIGNEDFGHLRNVRHALLSGERISVCYSNVTARRLANELTLLSGMNVHIPPGKAKVVVNYSGRGVTFGEILAQVSEVSGVQFSIR